MDANKILKSAGYGHLQNFGEISRWAAGQDFKTDQALLEAVESRFGKVELKPGMKVFHAPYKLFVSADTPVESVALDQLKTALRLPVANSGAGMPDIHPGYSLPIGGVVLLDHAVSPAFVGYDISCMVHLSAFHGVLPQELNDEAVRKDFMSIVLKSTSFGLGSGSGREDHAVMSSPVWDEVPFLRGLKSTAQKQLGSSGAGNHFADILVGENMEDNWRIGKAGEKWVGLLTHSGSRGVGNKVGHYYAHLADKETAKHYNGIPSGYGWFDYDSELGREYLVVMDLMGQYSVANHEIIHQKFSLFTGLLNFATIRNKHNFAWDYNGMVLHRKGATPAQRGELGVIPGSSGTPSYLVEGLGNTASLWSASHGAGRPRSRTASKALHNAKLFEGYMENEGITYSGVAPDETWQAYKNIDLVMDAQRDLVRPIACMLPKVVVMGGNIHSDDGD